MGKRERISRKLDAWLGRGFKAYKLKSLLGLTVSRLAVLRNLRRVRCDHARSDVAELLRQGHQERALLRAEYVIKEQNMMDAFAMMESYCHVVTERATLLENQKDCPDELREAIAGLLFSESRCGELPELHDARFIFASRLGKEFVAAAVELRNNCGVNPRIIQKLSTKQENLENRVKLTMDIAAEIGVALHLEEPSSELPAKQPAQPATGADDISGLGQGEYLSESTKMAERYKDAASAAQAAFESAAFAARAARAAVELSRSESQGKGGPSIQGSPRAPLRTTSGDRMSHPVQASTPETECEQGVKQGSIPVVHSPEGKFASPWGPKRGDPLPVKDKRRAYDTSEEVEDSEEEGRGGEEFVGKPSGATQNRALDSEDRSRHAFRASRQFSVSSEEDTSDEEVEEIKPRTTTFGWRSPAMQRESWERSQRQEPYRMEGTKKEEEEGHVDLHHGKSMVENAGMDSGDSAPVRKLGMGKVPVSMRTRRSVF